MRSKIATVVGKEFRHMSHDRLTLVLTILLPMAQLLLYGFALETRVRNVPAAVVNHDAHQYGRLLAQRISALPLFAVNRSLRSETDLQAGLKRGAIRIGIAIPSDYSANLLYLRKARIHVWLDGSDPAISNYLLSALDELGFEQTSENLKSRMTDAGLAAGVEVESEVLFNPAGRTSVFLIPGLIAILIQTITVLLMALSVANERENGTLEQMLSTPLGAGAIVAGKALAIGIVSIAECIGLMVLMRLFFRIPVAGSFLLLACLIPLLVLTPIGIGLLIAAKARNTSQALQLANLVLLPSILLSGFVVPREFLNFPIDRIAGFLPATYLVSLMRNIVLRGSPFTGIQLEIGIAAVFGIGLALAGFLTLRRSLRA